MRTWGGLRSSKRGRVRVLPGGNHASSTYDAAMEEPAAHCPGDRSRRRTCACAGAGPRRPWQSRAPAGPCSRQARALPADWRSYRWDLTGIQRWTRWRSCCGTAGFTNGPSTCRPVPGNRLRWSAWRNTPPPCCRRASAQRSSGARANVFNAIPSALPHGLRLVGQLLLDLVQLVRCPRRGPWRDISGHIYRVGWPCPSHGAGGLPDWRGAGLPDEPATASVWGDDASSTSWALPSFASWGRCWRPSQSPGARAQPSRRRLA